MTLAIAAIVVWIGLWALNVMLARWLPERQARIAVPIIFGLTLVLVVELLVTGLKVPFVILPKPSEMVARLFTSLPMLWEDFAQTILKGALTGYIMGCAAALFVAGGRAPTPGPVFGAALMARPMGMPDCDMVAD